MTFRLVAMLAMMFGKSVFAYDFPIEISEYIDDVKIDGYIKRQDINDKAHWMPFDSAPPLSVADALTAVKAFTNSEAEFENLALLGIELKQIPHHKGFWHYLVKVQSDVKGTSRPSFFIVLMDGKVIAAIQEPDSIK